MSDATIAALRQEEHLVLEGLRREGPSMAEHDRLSLAPVVVVDLRAVFGRDVAHRDSFTVKSLKGPVPWIPAPVERSRCARCIASESSRLPEEVDQRRDRLLG